MSPFENDKLDAVSDTDYDSDEETRSIESTSNLQQSVHNPMHSNYREEATGAVHGEMRVVYMYAAGSKNFVFSRKFPEALGKLAKLNYIWLQGYSFNSGISTSVLELTNLQTLFYMD